MIDFTLYILLLLYRYLNTLQVFFIINNYYFSDQYLNYSLYTIIAIGLYPSRTLYL